jgi:hypothetical protein
MYPFAESPAKPMRFRASDMLMICIDEELGCLLLVVMVVSIRDEWSSLI